MKKEYQGDKIPSLFDQVGSGNWGDMNVMALQAGVQACQMLRDRQGAKTLTWSHLACVKSHFRTMGPVTLVWNVWMALAQPQHIKRIGSEYPKALHNKEIRLLKEMLEAKIASSGVSIARSMRRNPENRLRAFNELNECHINSHKAKRLLSDFYYSIQSSNESVPHYESAANEHSDTVNDTPTEDDKVCSVRHPEAEPQEIVELHPDWVYREIDGETAGQHESGDVKYKIPDRVCNVKRYNELMQKACDGSHIAEVRVDSHSKTQYDGITYVSGTTTFGDKQHYCGAMLLDTGCDFNIASAWYMRKMLGTKWKEMIKPIPGHTVTARMATGHASKAIGTIAMEVTFSVMHHGECERQGPLISFEYLSERSKYGEGEGWSTATKIVEYLVFEGIDLPIINGAPFLSHVFSDMSFRDQSPTYVRMYDQPYTPGHERELSNQYVMVRRRRVAPVTQLLVCCAQKDTWISTAQPQAIEVGIPGCGRVPSVGVSRDGRIINDEPGLGDNEKRVRLRYLMDTVQQYGQMYDQQSRFLTHPDSRYMLPEDVNSKLNQGTLEVVVQGIDMNDESYGATRMYNRPQDDVITAVPTAIHKQGSGVYIKAGTPVALLEMEVIDDPSDETAINSIMDHRFTPTAVNEWAKEDHVYSVVSDVKDKIRPSNEMKADVQNKGYTWDHAHECMKPAFAAGEMRRYAAELSAQDDSTVDSIRAQAVQDLDQLFPYFTGDQPVAEWVAKVLDDLVTGTLLRTTRVHRERLIDRCRTAEAYRLLASDRTEIDLGYIQGVKVPTDCMLAYRQKVADSVVAQLRADLKSVLLRTHYMEQLKETLRSDRWRHLLAGVQSSSVNHVMQLLGQIEGSECAARTDEKIETMAAQLQGLLSEPMPPRLVQEESALDSCRFDPKHRVTGHDRLLCNIRAAHDESVGLSPDHVYVDPESGIARIHYVAADTVSSTVGEDGFRVCNISETTSSDDANLVASITDISSAIDSLEMGEGLMCNISSFTRGQCCRVAQSFRNGPKGRQRTPEEEEAISTASKQRAEIMEFISKDSEYQNPLESVLESTFQISPTLVRPGHSYNSWPSKDKMVSCEDVLDIIDKKYQRRIMDICRRNAPKGSSESVVKDRAKRLAGYLASTDLQPYTEEQRDDLIDITIDGEAVFNCDPHIPPCWRGEDWNELKLREGMGPITHRERPIPPLALPIILKQIKQWLEAGICVPSNSPHNSPLMAVVKKPLPPRRDPITGEVIQGPPAPLRFRVVVDYSALNRALKPVNMAGAPRLETVVHQVGSCGGTSFKRRTEDPDHEKNTWYCSTTDLMAGFHQSTIAPECRDLTAFIVPGVLGEHSKLEFVKAPFGSRSMPTFFSRMVGSALSSIHFGHLAIDESTADTEAFQKAKIVSDDQLAHEAAAPLLRDKWAGTDPGKCVCHYIDDCWVVTMTTWDDHITALRHMFHRLALHGLGARVDKSEFAQTKLGVLGWQVSEGKVFADMGKVHKMIESIGGPKCILKDRAEVQTALGSTNFYRTLIPNSGGIASILYGLTKTGAFKSPSDWTPLHSAALRALKTALLSDSFLAVPDENRGFILVTDSSSHSMGAVVAQLQPDGSEQPITYGAASLPTPARRWGSSEREMFAIIHFLDVTFRHLLVFAISVHIITDHKSLEQMVSASRSNNSKLARWVGRLAMWRNASVTYRAGILLGPADMISRLSESRSAAEMSALIPDSHKPVMVNRGRNAHLESGESGATDSIRPFGLPMQRLAMLKPPVGQLFGTAMENFEKCEDPDKDEGLCAEDPIQHASSKGKHDFDGLKDWFTPGKATPESVKRLIIDDAHSINLVKQAETVDVNDAPTATGSTRWHTPSGMNHADYARKIQSLTLQHPFQDRDLKQSEIFIAKVLDTRPIDDDYVEYYSGGTEVSLGGKGRLREMLIGWTEYETIPLIEILSNADPLCVSEHEEIVYSAHVTDVSNDSDYYETASEQSRQLNSVIDLTGAAEQIKAQQDTDTVHAIHGYVNNVLEMLSGPIVGTNTQQGAEYIDKLCDRSQGAGNSDDLIEHENIDTAFPATWEDTIHEIERLMFIEYEAASDRSLYSIQNKTDGLCRLLTEAPAKRHNGDIAKTAFSRRFMKQVIRRVANIQVGKAFQVEDNSSDDDRSRVRCEINCITEKTIRRSDKTTAENETCVNELTSRIFTLLEEFHTPPSAHTAHAKGTTKSELKRFMYNKILISNRCTATQAVANDTDTWQQTAEYTSEEVGEWKLIAEEVKAIATQKIDQVAENEDTAKENICKYVDALCDPQIDTVICQGIAGSGKTFTAMLCAFLALRKGLLQEVLHTRPLVSAGGVGVGFEPGTMGQKLSYWTKPMTDAFKRLDLDSELQSKVSPYPFDRIRGISMKPRTWLLGDEAQNMSFELLKCLVNRTEKHSKLVATGDVDQSDITLKPGSQCGLGMIVTGIKKKEAETEQGNNARAHDNDKGHITLEQISETACVIELKFNLRNSEGRAVRKWLEQLPAELKKDAKMTSVGRVTNVQQGTEKTRVPVFSAFAGLDNLGHAACKCNDRNSKHEMRVVGGSEIDAQARAAFRRRNGFEPMYENENVTADMLKGIYVLTAGAPCVAYSTCGNRRGLSAKVGTHYVNQIEAYTQAQIPVIILEQVPGAAEIQPNDTLTQRDGVTAQQQVEELFTKAGYHVERRVVNAADYGAAVSRERMITVAVRGDLHKKKKFTWPAATVDGRHRSRSQNTVRKILDPVVQKRYLLPQSRMYEFEESNNSGSSKAIKLFHRAEAYQTQPGIGNPYDPNTVYSLDGPAPSPTARGNSRYFHWVDEQNIDWFRRLSPREMARCMGVPTELIYGLNDVDAYRLVGNSVSESMSNVIGPIARSLIDDEILQLRQQEYSKKTPEVIRSRTNDTSDANKNGVVADCLHLQLWNRITQPQDRRSYMAEDSDARSLMPSHPDNKNNLDGQVCRVSGHISWKTGNGLNEEGQDTPMADALEGCVSNLNEEGQEATVDPRGVCVPSLNEEGQDVHIENTLYGCLVLPEDENCMTATQEFNDSELKICDSIDGGINTVSADTRLNAMMSTFDEAMFKTVEGCCQFAKMDAGRQQSNRDVWDTIRSGQQADEEVRAVYSYLVKGKSFPDRLNYLLPDARQCHVLEKVVYRVQEDNQAGPMLRLWVPKSMQEDLVRQTHECALSCHPREASMKRTIERRYFWPSMLETCSQVVRKCATCEKARRPPSKARDSRQIIPISKPMAVVAMDVVGPMGNAKSATSGKNRYIVSFIDWFTRYTVCYAVANVDAETIGDCIAKFTERLGTMLTLISDNAKYFTDAALVQYERRMGIKHSYVAAFRPEGNSILERFHSNLGRSMKVRAADTNSTNWDKELDSITFAYNIAEHGVTGYSPFFLLHGWHPTLPFDITAPPTESEYGSYSKWVDAAAKRLRTAHDCAYRRMTAAQVDRVKKHNSKAEPLKPGDNVYLWVPSVPRGAIKKLTLRWHGPYKVIGRNKGTRNFDIKTLRGIRTVHEHRIRKSWTDEQFAVDKDNDDEFENLLDDDGRVDGIFDGKHTWSTIMQRLLQCDPYESVSGTDKRESQDAVSKFDLAYVIGSDENWCQTTESARRQSREPAIDTTLKYENTTQADQIEQAAHDLVNQQQIIQHLPQCQKCKQMRSKLKHHSICWRCWYKVSTIDGRTIQATKEISKVCKVEVADEDIPDSKMAEIETDRYYRLARQFEVVDDGPVGETFSRCALCDTQSVMVGKAERERYCAGTGECSTMDTKNHMFIYNSSEPHVRINTDDEYEWFPPDDETEDTEQEDETISVKPVERIGVRDSRSYEISSVCGIEPKGSQYRIKWANHENKVRGETCTVQNVMNGALLVQQYLQSQHGITKTNKLRRDFHYNASHKIQKNKQVCSWQYESWVRQVREQDRPYQLIYRVVAISLQRSGSQTHESLVQFIKKNSCFPEQARFSAWIVPYGFKHRKVGILVVPVDMLTTRQVSLLFEKQDRDTMSVYADRIRTSLSKHRVSPHWVRTIEADERDDIIRNNIDESYEIPNDFYSR